MSKNTSVSVNDPLYPMQWHLRNTGQWNGATIGEDIHVASIWPDYTGRGIIVGVVDDGFDVTHPDLTANYRFDLSWDFVNSQKGGIAPSSEFEHGTAVAGLIASSAHNGLGGVGVAWNASLIGYRIIDDVDDRTLAQFFSGATQRAIAAGVDILNNSWGPMQSPFDNQLWQSNYMDAALDLVSSGRNGLGIIALFSAGNDREQGGNTNYDPTDNLPYAVIVAASDIDGRITDFSTPGASVLVTAPGVSTFTTDLQSDWGVNKLAGVAGNYADSLQTSFTGTSASAPIASGVVALMLEANPNLGYRDVQEILAYSARRSLFLQDEGSQFNHAVNWNGGGLLTSHDFGFGNIDAHHAVRLAETWQKTSTIQNLQLIEGRVTTPFASVSAGQEQFVKAYFDKNTRLEQITVTVDLDAVELEDLRLELISPHGTKSILIDKPRDDDGPIVDSLNYTFNSVQNWGETLQGEWTLRLINDSSSAPVILNGWSIKAYASNLDAPVAQIFTNEFDIFVKNNASRLDIDARNGVDLNASAITDNTIFDLSSGMSQLDGIAITLKDPALFRNLFSGDGNDRLIGNASNNLLLAGRGNNFIDGSQGDDIAAFIGERSLYDIELADQGFRVVSKGLSGGGVDLVMNIETFKFDDVSLPTLSALTQTQKVASFYDALFDRAPDADGLEGWIDAFLDNAISEKDIALRFTSASEAGIGSLSAEDFLMTLYQSALERNPDTVGYQAWTRALNSGQLDRGDVLLAFVNSSEYQTLASHLVAQDVSRLGNFWD